MEHALSSYGGRRFTLTVAAGILYTVLMVAGMLTEDGYITLQMMTVGAYMAASSVQKYAEAHRDAPKSEG